MLKQPRDWCVISSTTPGRDYLMVDDSSVKAARGQTSGATSKRTVQAFSAPCL